jgi:hypothetical protein
LVVSLDDLVKCPLGDLTANCESQSERLTGGRQEGKEMASVYTVGIWQAKAGRESEFAAAW